MRVEYLVRTEGGGRWATFDRPTLVYRDGVTMGTYVLAGGRGSPWLVVD